MSQYNYCPSCGNNVPGGFVTPEPITIQQPQNVQIYEQPTPAIPFGGLPATAVPFGGLPAPIVNSTVKTIGTARFDPDPRVVTRTVQPPPERRQVMGPYGPGGSIVPATGIYVPPELQIEETIDIPNHPVIG